ncbi:MAG: hypothetical protein ACM34K_13445 [Bacillota bacterium]
MSSMDEKRIANYDSMVSLLTCNRDIISTTRAFSYSALKFFNVINIIKRRQQVLKYQHFRKTFRTIKCKDDLIMHLLYFTDVLTSYAEKTGNKKMLTAYRKLTADYLLILSANKLINKAIKIHLAVEKILPVLREFNVNEQALHTLAGRIEDFKGTLSYHLEAECISGINEGQIEELFLNAEKLLANMDTYVSNMYTSYSGFYNQYVAVRNARYVSANMLILDPQNKNYH